MLYKKWLSDWLENYVEPSVKHRTYMRYKEIAEHHIITGLGELDLAEITPYVLQCYVTDLLKSGNLRTGKGLSASSVNSIITVIQNTLKTAYSLGMVDEYAGDKVKRPRSNEKKVECFSMSEQKKIEQYILSEKSSRMFGVLLCLYTGLRIGELLALEWQDIDMIKGELRVNKTCYYGKDENGIFGRITDIPKTRSSIRVIPIPRQLMPHLREIKKKSCLTQIVSNGSNLISIRSYQRSFASLLKRLNIPHRGFHSLRHTFATRALECGMDVKTLSEILGHKNPMVTANIYAHFEGRRTAKNINFFLLEFLLIIIRHITIKLSSMLNNTEISNFHFAVQMIIMVIRKLFFRIGWHKLTVTMICRAYVFDIVTSKALKYVAKDNGVSVITAGVPKNAHVMNNLQDHFSSDQY